MQRDTSLSGILRAGLTTVASWVGSNPARSSPRILISRNEQQAAADAGRSPGRLHRTLILQGGDPEGDDRPLNLFDALDDPEIWEARAPVVIGASICGGLHPVLVDALAALAGRRTGNRGRVRLQHGATLIGAGPPSPAAGHLAGWIANRVHDIGATDAEGLSIRAEELPYFIASTGWRARGLARTLDAVRAGREVPDIVDIGGAFGLMPWLLAAEPSRQVRRVTIVDPNTRYAAAAQSLWRDDDRLDKPVFDIAPTTADHYRFDRAVDLVLICQMMHRIAPPARAEVLRRCWEALRPDGLLAINEVVLNDEDSQEEGMRRGYRESPRQSEILGLLSRLAPPLLFRAATEWSKAEDPLAVAAGDYASDSFLVLHKPAG